VWTMHVCVLSSDGAVENGAAVVDYVVDASEFVQLTYEWMRVGPDGDHFAGFVDPLPRDAAPDAASSRRGGGSGPTDPAWRRPVRFSTGRAAITLVSASGGVRGRRAACARLGSRRTPDPIVPAHAPSRRGARRPRTPSARLDARPPPPAWANASVE
jgi:hypothetical protein